MKDLEAIKAIVFDFGNVIINIDFRLTFQAFAKFSNKTEDEIIRRFEKSQLIRRYEMGLFSDDEFFEIVRQEIGYPIDNKEIIEAWNALLLDIPAERMELIQRLKRKYPVYLLSNTNALHIAECNKLLKKNWGIESVHHNFTKAYLSYEIGLWKPDEAIYHYVIDDLKLQPNEILFLDDLEANVKAAANVGIQTIHVRPPECITQLISHLA